MDLLNNTNTEALFVSSIQQQQQVEFMASNALKSGIDLYQKKDYGGAARAFKGALSMAPNSSFSKDAAKYLAMAQLNLGETDKAIDLFKEATRLDSDFHDAHAEMGFAYADLGRMDDAEKIFDFLEKEAPDLADTLSRYMYKVDPPSLVGADPFSTFEYMMPWR